MAHDLSEEREADMLEDISTTARETASREFVCEETPIRPDDAVLSVGCGPGFETAALAGRVGADGRVHGVDVNEAVLARVRERCADSPEVTFRRGDVTALPVTDGAFDDAAVEAWERDLRELDAAGEFLSCSTAFLYIGRKPETATTGPCPRERR